jgi:hypothetical protein
MAGVPVEAQHAAALMELLGLSEDELCTALDCDPLSLLSGRLASIESLRILLELLNEAAAVVGEGVLRRWVRVTGPAGRPLDLLLARDFVAFEDALGELTRRGLVLRADA